MVTQATEQQEQNSGADWLEPSPSAQRPRLSWRGFSAIERSKDQVWVWSLENECAISAPARGTVYYSFVAPVAGTEVQVFSGGRAVRKHRATEAWREFSGKVDITGGESAEILFRNDQWNGKPERFSKQDDRPLGLLFKTLRLQPSSAKEFPIRTRKICPYPFSKMEVYSSKFAPCCTWWLKDELAYEGNDGDPWNSGAAQALRRSVLDGTYQYCKLDVCNAPLLELSEMESSVDHELPIAPENLSALRAGKTEMPAGPASVVVLSDPRCNLACPSCRKELITGLTEQQSQQLRETEKLLERYAPELRSIVLASNGEVFYSPFLRQRLKEATRERYPELEYVEIISNGLLFDEKSYDQLQPGAASIRKARISIDAGNEPSYRSVRGGDWTRLLKNLEWLGEMRAAGKLDNFRLNFVLRRENLESLEDFFRLAARLGVDEIFVSRVLPWSDAGLNFEHQDIFNVLHPEHEKLRTIWSQLLTESWPFKILGNVGASFS